MGGASKPSRPPRDWDFEPKVVRAREHLGRGRYRAAAGEAWKAAALAVNADDERGFVIVRALAREIEERANGRTQQQMAMLAVYVEHCSEASGAGVRQGSLLARLVGAPRVTRTKTCPECAEQVKARARVCRFCGLRFDAGES